MGLDHKFFLLKEKEVAYKHHANYLGVNSELKIHDDVIRYMNDSFLWVPSIHLSMNHFKEGVGLSLYGSTIINSKGSALFFGVIQAWKDLFSQAPNDIELTGTLLLDSEGKSINEFYKIKVKKFILIQALERLLLLKEEVQNGNCYILHIGI